MGPILIFDKSAFEGLSPDEAVWLDQFFITNITPLFFVETLADLEKKSRHGRTPEDIVGNLAYKTPDLHAAANVHHRYLLEGELSGDGELDMEFGRPHIGGGKYVELGGHTGVIFKEPPEEEALMRWREHKFLEIERFYAKQWRQELTNIDLEEMYFQYQVRFAGQPKPKNLEEVKLMVDKIIDDPNQEQVLISGLASIGASPKFQQEIITRWHTIGKPTIRKFAPYFVHILSVDLVFLFGIGNDLIGRGRPSHKIDIAYLYYLPFCMVFTSSDKLHKELAPLFLRQNQSFISGEELKEDLKKLDNYYDALPQETKDKGFYFFAPAPPQDASFLVTRLWEKHMSQKWKNMKGLEPQPSTVLGKDLMEKIKELEEKAEVEGTSQPSKPGESDELVIKRMVSGKRGKWTRFPPEVMNRRKNANGDWEDIPQK